MSWRQPAIKKTNMAARANIITRICAEALIRHLRNFERSKTLKKTFGLIDTVAWVLGFDAQEEAVTAGALKAGRVEYWMVRLGQPVEGQHAEDRRQRCPKHRAFE